MKKAKFYRQGNALVTLAFFMLIAAVVTTAATVILFSSGRSTTTVEASLVAYHAAESGVEDGILRVLRYNLTSGSGVTIGGATYDYSIQTTGPNTQNITATGRFAGLTRKILVGTTYNSGTLNVNSWQETF